MRQVTRLSWYHYFLAGILMTFLGCDYVVAAKRIVGLSGSTERVGIGPERTPAAQEAELIVNRNAAIREATQLTTNWSNHLRDQLTHHQGFTEEDPWGNQLEVSYADANTFDEVVRVVSWGPDGQRDTRDDIIRTELRQSVISTSSGVARWLNSWVGILLIIWAACAALVVTSVILRRQRPIRHPYRSAFFVALVSPVLVVILIFQIFIVVLSGLLGDGDFDHMPTFIDFDCTLWGED